MIHPHRSAAGHLGEGEEGRRRASPRARQESLQSHDLRDCSQIIFPQRSPTKTIRPDRRRGPLSRPLQTGHCLSPYLPENSPR